MSPLFTPERALLVLRALVTGTLAIRVEGAENMPAGGGAVLVANHSDYIDPLVQALFTGRHLTFLGKAEMLELRWLEKIQKTLSELQKDSLEGHVAELADELLNVSGQVIFDIYRQTLTETEAGDPAQKSDRLEKDLPALSELLQNGHIIALYQNRKANASRFMRNLPALLALSAGVPLIPAGLMGTQGLSKITHWLMGRNIGRAVIYEIGQPIIQNHPADAAISVQFSESNQEADRADYSRVEELTSCLEAEINRLSQKKARAG